MFAVFAVLAAVGTALVLWQLLATAVGLDYGHGHDFGHDALHGDGLVAVRSLRAMASGIAAAGFAGLLALALGLGAVVAVPAALVAGWAGMQATVRLLRRVHALDEDASLRLADTLGERATVYVAIAPDSVGKVHLTLRERTVEVRAIAAAPIPTGAPVVVTNLHDDDTVVVEPA